jgi:hypothetical protein
MSLVSSVMHCDVIMPSGLVSFGERGSLIYVRVSPSSSRPSTITTESLLDGDQFISLHTGAACCLHGSLWYGIVAYYCVASAAGAIRTTESPAILSAWSHSPRLQVLPTSHKQHLALLLDRPHAGLLVVVFLLRNENGFFDVSENKVAMRVVCLFAFVRTLFRK